MISFHLFSQLKCLHNVFLSDIFSTRIEFGCCSTRTGEDKHFCWSMILDSQLRPKAGFVDHVVTVSRYIVCERKKENTARLAMCSCRHVQFSCVCIINLKLASSPDNVIMFGCVQSLVSGQRCTDDKDNGLNWMLIEHVVLQLIWIMRFLTVSSLTVDAYFPINTYSNFGRPSTQWPNRRAKMKNMFFCWILDPKSYLFIVIVERGSNSIHETAWKLEHFWWIPLIHIDTIIILFGYRLGLDRHQNVSNSTSEIATTRCLKCGVLPSQFQKQVSTFVFWVLLSASSLETIGGDVIIGPSTTIKSEGHCSPPTFRWNVLVRATLLTGV